jgi:spore coat protein U-like protein
MRVLSAAMLFMVLLAVPAGQAFAALAAASANATAKATVLKPLTLTLVQDFNLGTIILGPGTWAGAVVSLNQAGVLNCGSANLTCAGAVQPASYRITGSNRQVVTISAPDVVLTNTASPGQQLILTLDKPSSVTIPNSGNQGVLFAIGGRVTLSSTTPGGLYSGTLNVTVDY